MLIRKFSLVGWAFLGLATPAWAQQPLMLPPAIDAQATVLVLQEGMYPFLPGSPTMSMGANGPVLGPTLIVNQGDEVSWTVVNALSDSTTLHWHGMHVAPENDGGPHTPIPPNGLWNPTFEVLDAAGTYWYHPHLHHMTDHHVSMGIAGQIWVRDATEQALPLPRTYGVDEFPLILQTKGFDAMGMVESHTNSDDVAMVNATVGATLEVPASVVRLHLLNAASQRVFQLGFSDNRIFHLIATDGGLLPAGLALNRLRLAPGERAEILVNCTDETGVTFDLMSFASELPNAVYGASQPGMGPGQTLTNYNPNPLNGADFPFLTFQVVPAFAEAVYTVPTVLDPSHVLPWTAADADVVRTFTFSPTQMGPGALNGGFLINGTPFDMEVMNFDVQLGDTERWEITNQSPIGHPFHVHNTPFYILDRNGVAPEAQEAGLKDVVFVPAMGSVRLMMQFNDFAHPDIPYMYHCHMLTHEDGGMMGQFRVLDGVSSVSMPTSQVPAGTFAPNPARGQVLVDWPPGAEGARVVSGTGAVVCAGTRASLGSQWDLSGWAPGVYMVLWEGRVASVISRLVVE